MNNEDTISRARIEEIRSRYTNSKTADDYRMMPVSEIAQMSLDIKRLLKAVDAKPPGVHGRWQQIVFYRDKGYQRWQCTACKYEDVDPTRHYCPNCGAKMDGGTNDATD